MIIKKQLMEVSVSCYYFFIVILNVENKYNCQSKRSEESSLLNTERII